MEPTKPPRDIAAIILDIIRMKEDWKYALQHEDDLAVCQHLARAVHIAHELDFAVNKSIYAMVEAAMRSPLKAVPPEQRDASGWSTKPGVPMVEEGQPEIDRNDPQAAAMYEAIRKLRDSLDRVLGTYEDDSRAP